MSSAGVAWGLMWVTGLLVEDIEGQRDQTGRPLLPDWLQRFLNMEVRQDQFWSRPGLLLPSIAWSGARERLISRLCRGFLAGVAAAFVVLVVACTAGASRRYQSEAAAVYFAASDLEVAVRQSVRPVRRSVCGSLVWAIGSSCGRPAAESGSRIFR